MLTRQILANRFAAAALAAAVAASALAGCSEQNSRKPGAGDRETAARGAQPSPHVAGSTGMNAATGTGAASATGPAAIAAGAPAANTQASPTGVARVTASGLSFEVPNAWAAAPPTNAMRKAQYRIPAPSTGIEDGELVLFFFGEGQGGDAASNLARWRGQISADAGAPSEAKENAFTVDGLSVKTVDVSGTYASGMPGAGAAEQKPGWRLIAAVVEGTGGPWFFKAVGPKETMAAVEDDITAMLQSVQTGG